MSAEPPIDDALVSVTRNGCCRVPRDRSACRYSHAGPPQATKNGYRPPAGSSGAGQLQVVLGGVVDVGADDVQRLADLGDVQTDLAERDAGGDELVLGDQAADELGLPAR